MKSIIKRTLPALCLFALAFSPKSFAGEPWPEKSNFGSAEFTSLFGFSTASLNYEIMWHKEKIHHGLSAGLTAVIWDSFGWSKFGPSARYTLMTGQGNNHFEFTTGASYNPVKFFGEDRTADGESSNFVLFGQIGYRYLKPGGKAYFKVFVGFPVAGLGAGVRF